MKQEPLSRDDPDQECLLLAAVCDIRGFTRLQARIDDYIVSTLTSDNQSVELANHKRKFARQSRRRAEQVFIEHVAEHVDSDDYAIKSTGDGFLVAVRWVTLKEGIKTKIRDDSYYKRENRKVKIEGLIRALQALYVDSDLNSKAKNSIGSLTRNFLITHGRLLGISWRECIEKGEYRIPGALAMGAGTLTPANVRFDRKPPGNVGDAHGHPVNVAFRLCDKAGRRDGERDELSPAVLCDRRVGRILETLKVKFAGWEARRGFPVPELKGLEENWCYGFCPTRRKRGGSRMTAKQP